MITPDTELVAQKLIIDIIENLKTLDQCGSASDVIDAYEKEWTNKEMTQQFRDILCDKTFEVYREEVDY
jgi:hypothetical protein